MFLADNCIATRAMARKNGVCAQVISLLTCVLSIVSCQPDIPMVNLGIDENYAIERMRTLILHPEFPGERYEWYLTSSPLAYRLASDSLISTTRDLIFCAADTGTYHIRFDLYSSQLQRSDLQPEGRSIGATNLQRVRPNFSHHFVVKVWKEQIAYSPYISRVLEYNPAPGQFVNTMPQYEEGDTYATMLQKSERSIAGTNNTLISLGAWGGYITFAFDHSVINTPKQSDFLIEGNSFYASTTSKGGSSEPGIVMVSIDMNQNGLPDDPFYQLAGSEFSTPNTLHHYSLTYHRTPANHTPQPDLRNSLTDSAYIRWIDNQNQKGYLHKNTFHTQEYFPQWLADSTLTFVGSRLPNNAYDPNGQGAYWVQSPFDYGYADCHPNDSIARCSFDIDWAVTDDGHPIHLPCVDFVRVYTGVFQQCGWTGEISTEISHARDLNISKE